MIKHLITFATCTTLAVASAPALAISFEGAITQGGTVVSNYANTGLIAFDIDFAVLLGGLAHGDTSFNMIDTKAYAKTQKHCQCLDEWTAHAVALGQPPDLCRPDAYAKYTPGSADNPRLTYLAVSSASASSAPASSASSAWRTTSSGDALATSKLRVMSVST